MLMRVGVEVEKTPETLGILLFEAMHVVSAARLSGK